MKHRNRKQINCLISIVLVIVMLFTGILPVFAVTITTDKEELTGADIVSEDVSKREEFVKHYLTGDGTYFAVSYAEQVHYLDDNGNWKEVDNTISTNILTGEKSTKNDKFKVKFANKANKDKLVSIQTDEFKVSWGLSVSEDGTAFSALNKVKGVENEALKPKEIKTTTDAQSLGKAVSGIIYEDAFGDYLDVRYSVAYQKIKEDLILNEKSEFTSYKVTYNVNNIKGAYAVLDDNGEVTFYDENDTALFKAGLPVMYDAAGEVSADIDVQVTQSKKTIEVVYTPSSEWLNGADRVYPVTVDPSIQSKTYESNYSESAYCFSSIPYEIIPTQSNSQIAVYNDQSYYLKINTMPNVPASANVAGVDLILTASYICMDYDDSFRVDLLTSYWTPGGLVAPDGSTSLPTADGYSMVPYFNAVSNYSEYYQISLNIPNNCLSSHGGYNGYLSSYEGFKISVSYSSDSYITLYSGHSYTAYRPTLVVRYDFDETTDLSSDKLYKIKNVNTNAYLTYNPDNSSFGGTVSLQSSPYSFFKLSYNTTVNAYTIIPYVLNKPNTAKFLGFYDDPSINPATESTIQPQQYTFRWLIDAKTVNGSKMYRLYSQGDAAYTIGMYQSGGNVFSHVCATNYGDTGQEWFFEQCENEYTFGSNYDIFVGISETVFLNSENPVQSWESSDTGNAVVDDNGMVTTLKPGRAVITAYDYENYPYSITVNVLLPDGEYFIKNRHVNNRRYLQIDDNVDDTPDGAFMELWAFSGEDNQIWEISHVGNGYYHILSKASGLALMVPYNKQNIENEKIVQGTYYYGNENQLWRITQTEYESFKIANKATIEDDSNLVMCMGTTLIENSDGVNVLNRPYVDNESFRDEWYIETIPQYDEYEQLFIEQFGFSADVSEDLVKIYYGLKGKFPLEDDIQLAWHYSRIIGGLYYDFYSQIPLFAWNDICGNPEIYDITMSQLFVLLGYTNSEYYSIINQIKNQHENILTEIDLAHMQMALAGRLAYELNKDGFLSNIGGIAVGEYSSNLEVSYLAGWLGDAVLSFGENNKPSLKNDDYTADLDAENVYHLIKGGMSYFDALTTVYNSYNSTKNRASVFLSHIPYNTVEELVLKGLFSSSERTNLNYCYEQMKTNYKDTYNFLWSLRNLRHERGIYA